MFRLFFNNCSPKKFVGQLLRHNQKMYSQTATELNKLSNHEVKTWLESFDTVLTDCDGKSINTYVIVPYMNFHHTILFVRCVMDVQQCYQRQP